MVEFEPQRHTNAHREREGNWEINALEITARSSKACVHVCVWRLKDFIPVWMRFILLFVPFSFSIISRSCNLRIACMHSFFGCFKLSFLCCVHNILTHGHVSNEAFETIKKRIAMEWELLPWSVGAKMNEIGFVWMSVFWCKNGWLLFCLFLFVNVLVFGHGSEHWLSKTSD